MTEVTIKWADDGEEMDTLIAGFDEVPEGVNEDDIFFFGMSRDRLIRAMNNHTLIEGEWYVVDVR